MRERLIRLLQGAYDKYINLLEFEKNIIADHLIENGVFAPPCKPGDKAYFVIEDTEETYVSAEEITDVSTKGFFVNGDGELNPYSGIGKTVFLNLEDADAECERLRNSKIEKDYDFEEICPHCDFVNEVAWDGKSRTVTCAGCGKEIVLCSACEDMRCGNCPYDVEIGYKAVIKRIEDGKYFAEKTDKEYEFDDFEHCTLFFEESYAESVLAELEENSANCHTLIRLGRKDLEGLRRVIDKNERV